MILTYLVGPKSNAVYVSFDNGMVVRAKPNGYVVAWWARHPFPRRWRTISRVAAREEIARRDRWREECGRWNMGWDMGIIRGPNHVGQPSYSVGLSLMTSSTDPGHIVYRVE